MMSDNLYILRVRLRWAKGVWREIAIRGDQNLEELHYSILDAFEWSNDDTYGFFMTNDLADFDAYYKPGEEPRNSKTACLDDFRLEEEDTFLYIFGEGERNQFSIRVMMLDEPDPHEVYPDVVDEHGESPEQELAYLDE
jgi:hypothetical protein